MWRRDNKRKPIQLKKTRIKAKIDVKIEIGTIILWFGILDYRIISEYNMAAECVEKTIYTGVSASFNPSPWTQINPIKHPILSSITSLWNWWTCS